MTGRSLSNQASRLSKVRQQLKDWKVDALLVGSPANRRWLSGFSGSAGWLLISADRAVLGTDSRYWEQASIEAPQFELLKFSSLMADNWPALLDCGGSRVGVEAQHMTIAVWQELQRATTVNLIPLDPTLEPLREVKTSEELQAQREAAQITDRVMAEVPQIVKPGSTEKQVAWELEKRLRESGADGLAFPVIVASGPNSALPHHQPGDRWLRPGEPLLVDIGATIRGYHSDLTRTFHLGEQPASRFQEVYEIVLAAQAKALANIVAGMTCRTADGLARAVIEAAGYGDNFGHPLGHGIGLTVHEAPRLSPSAGEHLVPLGAVVTVEPGIYLPGWGGVRIEDLVLATEEGLQLLSHCPHEPIIAC